MSGEVTPEKLSAPSIYQISKWIEYIRIITESEITPKVVYDDGSIEKNGKGFLLFAMINLSELLLIHGLAKSEINALNNLIEKLKEEHTRTYQPGWSQSISREDLEELKKLIQRIDVVLENEFMNRPFVELSFSGLLNYPELLNKGISTLFASKDITKKTI